MMIKSFSVVIPAHNEGEHIEQFVEQFLMRLDAATHAALREVVIVENGSTDDTYEAGLRLQSAHPDTVRILKISRGSYGEAIKHGMLASRAEYIAILECDFLDAAFVSRAQDICCDCQARFVVASKRHDASEDHRPLQRRLLTWGFNMVLRVVCGYPGTDTHGLKFIDAPLAHELCHVAETTDEVFQTEIVLLAWHRGTTIHELPIYIAESRHHRVPILKRVPKIANMIWQLRKSLHRFPRASARVERH
jgi:glycosyltransferase involved in cell wall biosynthesis